jgi:hypothetical protein
MTPKPIAIGLLLCDRVIVDKDTNSPSAIGIFTGLAFEHFPSDSQRLSVLSVLTNAQGVGRGKLVVYRLNEHWLRQEEIYATEHTIQFPDLSGAARNLRLKRNSRCVIRRSLITINQLVTLWQAFTSNRLIRRWNKRAVSIRGLSASQRRRRRHFSA